MVDGECAPQCALTPEYTRQVVALLPGTVADIGGDAPSCERPGVCPAGFVVGQVSAKSRRRAMRSGTTRSDADRHSLRPVLRSAAASSMLTTGILPDWLNGPERLRGTGDGQELLCPYSLHAESQPTAER